jgi:hypothetical protein
MRAPAPLDENDKRRLVLKLVTRLRCVECNELYEPQAFSLVHRWQDVWVLSARCGQCGETARIIILMRLDAEAEPVVDLTPEELKAVEDWPPITTDDVLDVHAALSEFDGDFEALFAD